MAKMKQTAVVEVWHVCLFALLMVSCRAPDPESRALLDESIGQLESETFSFHADGGLLHIVRVEGESLELRAVAPSFEFTIRNKSAAEKTLSLRIDNIPSDTKLLAREPGELSEKETLSPTGAGWTLKVPASSEVWVASEEREEKAFRFLATGDIQDAVDTFGDVVSVINAQPEISFFLFLGDITMQNGSDEFEKVEEQFVKLNVPVYSTPGNHDVSSSHNNYHRFFGRASYSFVYRGARFTSVDSSGWTLAPRVWDWYRSWLDDGREQLHVIFSHIASTESFGLRGGHWRSRREAAAFQAYAARGQVNAFLFGHLHTLDQLLLAGVPTFISGGAGAFQEYFDGIERHLLHFEADPLSQSLEHRVIRVDL